MTQVNSAAALVAWPLMQPAVIKYRGAGDNRGPEVQDRRMDANEISIVGIVIGAVIAVATGIAGLWAARRFGSHRGSLQIDVRNVEIVGKARLVQVDSDTGTQPEYETEVVDPEPGEPDVFVVQLRIRNRGFHDIDVDAFSGKPLVLSLGGNKTVATGSISFFGLPFMPAPEPGARKMEIGPVRIPRHNEWGCAVFACGEPPRVVVHSPLRDVDVKLKNHRPKVSGPGIVFDSPSLYGYRKPRNLLGFARRVRPY
jgi:hypothetical protein